MCRNDQSKFYRKKIRATRFENHMICMSAHDVPKEALFANIVTEYLALEKEGKMQRSFQEIIHEPDLIQLLGLKKGALYKLSKRRLPCVPLTRNHGVYWCRICWSGLRPAQTGKEGK